jgi:hypothetical protein
LFAFPPSSHELLQDIAASANVKMLQRDLSLQHEHETQPIFIKNYKNIICRQFTVYKERFQNCHKT